MKWLLFGPEIYYFAVALAFLALSLTRPNGKRDFRAALGFSGLGVVVTLAGVPLEGVLFHGTYGVDLFSQLLKALLSVGLFLVVALCAELHGVSEKRHAEFYLLLTTSTLGMMLLVSSAELLVLYVALELTSYSLYVLVPLRKGADPSMEAGIKYFLAGIATSALMLFGMAALFGAAQTTSMAQLSRQLPGLLHTPMAFVGLLFTLCGFFFKLALFPFHSWAPNVYQGSANQVAAFVATATKVAAIAMLVRLVAASGENDTLARLLMGLAIASMTYGNLVALVQRDLKRLLAYSAIGHAGYALMGVLTMSPAGYGAALFYAPAYLAMTFTCFLVIVKLAADGRDLAIEELAGLHRRSPALALALMVAVFSLGGIPPTIGFTGKFLIFAAAMDRGYFLLVLIAMVNVVVSLYYYIQIVRAAYLLEPREGLPPIRMSVPERALAWLMVLAMLAGGFFPQNLMVLTQGAVQALLPILR
jgi:NADH-quinone oxidoreductase subunit N